jgi:hypothetical protein
MRVPIEENVVGNRTVVRFRKCKFAGQSLTMGSYAISEAASTCAMSNGDSILSIAGRSTEST